MVYLCSMSLPDFTPTMPVMVRTRSQRFGAQPMILLRDQRMSYAEADERSARLARGMLASGLGKGSRVGIWLPNGPDWVTAFLAAARIGAIVIPLNTFYKPRELAWVMRHADVGTLFTLPRFLKADHLERLEAAAPSLASQKAGALHVRELPYLRDVFVFGHPDRAWARPVRSLDAAADANPAIDDDFLREVESCVVPADPLVVIYSSGSTADPKGAVHTHGTLIRHSLNLNSFRDLRPDDRMFSPMPFFWVGGLVYALMAAMHVGALMLCEEAFEPGETLALLEREGATIVAGWPHYSKAMMEHPSFRSRDLSAIRAGNLYDILPAELRPRDPELRSNSLGMTETCGPHTIDRMDVDRPESLRGSFGRPVPGVTHKIVDPESGVRLPAGELGEVCVKGYSLMQGLYKVEREDCFDGEGFYHTGDAGYFDPDGVFFFKARMGDMIKTAGANVTPREVEIVMESQPEVRSAFVVGVPDPVRGQNVAAAVILKVGSQLGAETLRERLRADLSAYKVPRHFFFYRDGELPFTDTGKIDKKKLAALLGERIAQGTSG
jgi:acyl-CoA synthetase (AMP-forming)/AMP-acid ligase II